MGREVFFNLPQAAVLLILILPIIAGQLLLIRYRKKQQLSYAPIETLSRLVIPRSRLITVTKNGGWNIIWALACFALMEPFGNVRFSSIPGQVTSPKGDINTQLTPHEIIFLLDTSASMGVPDGRDGNTRLEEAKNIMEDIMRQLTGETVSLYAFTSELSAVVPPTVDYLFVRLSINELHINEGEVGGTRFTKPLSTLQQQAFPEKSSKRYSILMLTDGGDTQLETLTGEQKNEEIKAILNALSNPQELHVRLFPIGIGSLKPQPIPHVTDSGKPASSKLEPDILKQLAAKDRGKFYMASEHTSWELAQELKKEIDEEPAANPADAPTERYIASAQQEDALVDWYFQVPLGLALLFYLINLLLPDVRRL